MNGEQGKLSDRSILISRLLTDQAARTAYVFAKLGVLVPSQVRGLRLKSGEMPLQKDLARAAKMQQSRISMLETPGAANVTLETLSKVAAAFKVGVVVKFVPFSDMLRWENEFSQDDFNVRRLEQDETFLNPDLATVSLRSLEALASGSMAYAPESRIQNDAASTPFAPTVARNQSRFSHVYKRVRQMEQYGRIIPTTEGAEQGAVLSNRMMSSFQRQQEVGVP